MQTQEALPQRAAKKPRELQMPRDNRPNAYQRKDPMCRIHVRSRVENQLIPGGYLLPEGDSVALVYTPDLPIIQAMIETDTDAIAQAERFFMTEVEASIADELRTISDASAREARLAQARQEYCGSVQAKFRDLFKRDIKPLDSVTVLEQNIPAPVEQQQVEQQSFLASTIAREVSQALAQALPSILGTLTKEIAAAQKQRG